MSVSTNLLSASVSDVETTTTGWSAGTNTTLALGTRGYTGSASLKLTATATNTVSATTVTRVAVTAGQVYTAYGYAALETAATGRSVNVFIAWYNAPSGGSPLSYSTSPSSSLANSTAFQTPPPILIATAPAGATYAVVGINVMGLTAGQAALFDAVALGLPALISGNLMTYAAQSVEQDGSAWTALAGATVTRSSTAALEGWWSLLATSTASSGTADVGTTAVPVTAGTEYLAYAWVHPGQTGTVSAELRWQDASSSPVGTAAVGSWPSLPSGNWTRVGVAGSAPTGATKAQLVIRAASSAVGQTWLIDQAAAVQVTNEPGNLIGYGPYSMEGGVGGWTASGGGSIAASTAQAAEGSTSLALTCTGTADAVVSLAPIPVTAGQAYRFRPSVRPPVDGLTYTVRLDWVNAGGQTIRQTSSGITAGSSSTWTYSYTSDLAPTGAVSVRPSIVRSGASPGEVWYVDKAFLAAGGLAAWAEPTTAGYGAVIHVQGLTTDGRNRWGLWRTTPDGMQTPVRGYSGDLVSETTTGDATIVEDYEAPLGVPVAYYLKAWTAPAGTDWTAYTVDWLTLQHPDPLCVVLKDPALPARNLRAVVTTMPTWKRAARQGAHSIRGRARPVILTDVRSSRTGSVVLSTATDTERQALVWLLESGHTLLAQWPPGWGEADVYLQVGDLDEGRPSDYSLQPDREWTLALTEVDRPIGGLVGSAGRTWQTVKDSRATWAEVLAGSRTWLDVLTGVGGS
ncbi:hypothetical protein ACFVHB_20055 [Kitasatospora sp. NPDC127111]|uniref:hypothetical protein n=1 Tax=Kitasatospora sp. NPDC127111 TaxID=3345363 RepID=UPI003641EAC5